MSIQLEIDKDLIQFFDNLSKSQNIHRDKAINKVLKNFMAMKKLEDIQQEMKGRAEQCGFNSEEEILNSIS